MQTKSIALPLGEIVVTEAVRSILQFSGEVPETFLDRHQRGDWGDVNPESWAENDDAAATGRRVWSAYMTEMMHTVWIITEGDRRFTRVIAPHQF